MPRFFIDGCPEVGGSYTVTGEDAHHIARSLRMAVGEELTLCDQGGREYSARILHFEEDRSVDLEILSVHTQTNEPPTRIVLYQALPKGDKLETVIQKAVECGAAEIVPFESSRCVVRVKADAEDRKTERRGRIAAEAAKQCGRSLLPQVRRTVGFGEMLEEASQSDLAIFCYEGEGTVPLGEAIAELIPLFKRTDVRPTVSVIVGSEGGFSPEEAAAAKARGLRLCGLGKRILRTETASPFVLACLCYATELQV